LGAEGGAVAGAGAGGGTGAGAGADDGAELVLELHAGQKLVAGGQSQLQQHSSSISSIHISTAVTFLLLVMEKKICQEKQDQEEREDESSFVPVGCGLRRAINTKSTNALKTVNLKSDIDCCSCYIYNLYSFYKKIGSLRFLYYEYMV